MYDDKYIEKAYGIPVVTYYANYNFKKSIPEIFAKTPDGKNVIFTHQHCHSDCEMIYVENGEADFVINNNSFRVGSGEIAIANPYDIHYAVSPVGSDTFSYYCIDFDLDFILDKNNREVLISDIPEHEKVRFKNHIPHCHCAELAEYIKNTHNAYKSSSVGRNTCIKGNLLLIISLLLQYGYYIECLNINDNFMKSTYEYIKENYPLQITSKNAAEHLSYNHSYFCRSFKNSFSCTFGEFLNIYRIKQATSMIENGSKNVSKLAVNVGFNNFSYFSRMFKKYNGQLPSDYIANFQKHE